MYKSAEMASQNYNQFVYGQRESTPQSYIPARFKETTNLIKDKILVLYNIVKEHVDHNNLREDIVMSTTMRSKGESAFRKFLPTDYVALLTDINVEENLPNTKIYVNIKFYSIKHWDKKNNRFCPKLRVEYIVSIGLRSTDLPDAIHYLEGCPADVLTAMLYLHLRNAGISIYITPNFPFEKFNTIKYAADPAVIFGNTMLDFFLKNIDNNSMYSRNTFQTTPETIVSDYTAETSTRSFEDEEMTDPVMKYIGFDQDDAQSSQYTANMSMTNATPGNVTKYSILDQNTREKLLSELAEDWSEVDYGPRSSLLYSPIPRRSPNAGPRIRPSNLNTPTSSSSGYRSPNTETPNIVVTPADPTSLFRRN